MTITVLEGQRMNADDAAWASIADAAEAALTLPGVSVECQERLRRMVSAGDRAAGLPPRTIVARAAEDALGTLRPTNLVEERV